VTTLAQAPTGLTTRASDALRAAGERRVVRVLRALGPDWVVVPSVPLRGCPRAALVVGPPGAVLVEPRWYVGHKVWVGAGLVIVDGVKTDDVRRARQHAAQAGALLERAAGYEVPVLGAVALLSQTRTVRSQPVEGDVVLLGPRELAAALLGRPPVLPPGQVADLGRFGEDLATWYPLGRSRAAVAEPIDQV
jgi:hypothetical protein